MSMSVETDDAFERRRLDALEAYGVLDTPPEPDFDRLTRLAARLCGTSMAVVSLVDSQRQWFKSTYGLDVRSTDRAVSFCAQAIQQRGIFVVEDATTDSRFADNPLVCGDFGLRFYAGAPLLTPGGEAIGALAVLDRAPGTISEQQAETLQALADEVVSQLEARRRNRVLEATLVQRRADDVALRDSEARWRMLFERNPLPMWVFDRETRRFLAVNDAAVVHYGWSHAEFIAMTLDEIRPLEDVPALLDDLAGFAIGLAGAQRWRHKLKNGRIIHVEITAHSLPFNGRPGRLVMANDITERLAAEDALLAAEARWRRLFDASAIGIASCSADCDILSANPAFCTMLGRDEADLLGTSVERYSFADDWPVCSAGLVRVLAVELDVLQMEKRWVHADGSVVWSRCSVTLLKPSGWDKAGLVAVVQDITVQREAEARLREQAALLNEAQDAIIVTTLDGHITFWNRSAERIFGWSPDDALGRLAAELLVIDPVVAQDAHRTLLAEGAFVATMGQRHRDGHTVAVDVRWTLLRDGGGQPHAVLCIKTDVTQRLALEAQLQQSSRLEAIGQLTGGVAHDFNNLLTVILGNADLLAEQLADQPALLALAQMTRTAAERAAELTQRLLAFARRQALQPRPVDTNRLTAAMDALLRRTLPASIELVCVPAPHLWPAMVDAAQLESALLNLVLNARDAMPAGGRLTIEADNVWIDAAYAERHADVLPGPHVRLSVTDTGIGMNAHELARAFEPFFTTKAVGKGSGLGLSMVYGFVKQSRGHVKLYSEVGHGTTVHLYLPRAETAAQDPAGASAAPPCGEAAADYRGHATVLVVEDDALVRRHATDVLGSLGYTVLAAEQAGTALALLRTNEDVELLFTDIMMPGGMNGRELADAARLLRPDIKVLYTSGYAENAILHHGQLDPHAQLLSKPYRSVDLARKVHGVINDAKAGPNDHR